MGNESAPEINPTLAHMSSAGEVRSSHTWVDKKIEETRILCTCNQFYGASRKQATSAALAAAESWVLLLASRALELEVCTLVCSVEFFTGTIPAPKSIRGSVTFPLAPTGT